MSYERGSIKVRKPDGEALQLRIGYTEAEMSFHDLRHYHASILLGEGAPLPDVSKRLGHASPDITAKIYAHAIEGNDARLAELAGNVMAGAGS